MPLWTRFPGAEEVQVLRQAESDTDEPRFDMVLPIRYPSRDAIALALASDARHRSRAATAEPMEHVDGDTVHTLFEGDSVTSPAGEAAA